MDANAGHSLPENVSVEMGGVPSGDLIFLSTDASGTPGNLNVSVLSKLGYESTIIPPLPDLSSGYAIVSIDNIMLCFVVTVAGNTRTERLLYINLKHALDDPRVSNVREIWLPLMGTGAGKLTFELSQKTILNALNDAGWLNRKDAHITLAYPSPADPSSDLMTTKEKSSAKPINEDNAYHAPLPNKAVQAALQFASTFREGRRNPDGHTSTSLLFFALAQSQTGTAPEQLAVDRAACLFSGAVHFLAGSRFQEAWSSYFVPGYRGRGTANMNIVADSTPNVRSILQQSAKLAARNGHQEIEVGDLVLSLLNFASGRYRLLLTAMGVSPETLLTEYQEALLGQIGTALLGDVATVTDRLGYDNYSEAIKTFIVDSGTPPPISISIQAPWGAGKSSLMRQIRAKIDPSHSQKNDRDKKPLKLSDVMAFLNQKSTVAIGDQKNENGPWTVWLNAWKYESSEQLWAGLVDAIVSQITARLARRERELFLLRLQLARVDDGIVRRRIYERIIAFWLEKVHTIALWCVASLGSLIGIRLVASEMDVGPILLLLVTWSPLGPMVGLAVYLVCSYYSARRKVQEEPASFSLSEYLDVPNYGQLLGSMHHIHEDLLRVLALTPADPKTKISYPIVVFIDDLDRCSPSRIASVVEGVTMFLASDEFRCVFVIGIDPQMVAAALEEAHAKVRDQLPRYERTVPLGWRFMDKFIQLPFTIPPANAKTLTSFIEGLSGTAERQVKAIAPPEDSGMAALRTGTSDEGPKNERRIQAFETKEQYLPETGEPERLFRESRDVGATISEASKIINGNPREIKRLANMARLYLSLRNVRRTKEPTWRSPTVIQYARWITVALRWPDMMRWLQWGADEASWSAKELVHDLVKRRLLFLENATDQAKTPEGWTKLLVETLKVPGSAESDWASDPKLFEFFEAEAQMDASERLSSAAGVGFW